jgi:hypothetical protein
MKYAPPGDPAEQRPPPGGKETEMKIAISDLRPNPFRRLDRYPVSREKIEALKASIKDTGFWDNLLCRAAPDGRGYQLGYGHSRHETLKELAKTDPAFKFIDIPVRDLSDEAMLKMMAQENRLEWAGSATIEQETVRTTVEAFAKGKIKLANVNRKQGTGGSLRYAPHFRGGEAISGRLEIAYSAETVAEFLGFPTARVEAALSALAAVETGAVDKDDLEGLSVYQADMVAREVRRAEKEFPGRPIVARQVGKTLAAGMQNVSGTPRRGGHYERGVTQSITLRNARHAANEVMIQHRPLPDRQKPLPEAGKAIPMLAGRIEGALTPDMIEKIKQVIPVRFDLHPHDLRLLTVSLRDLARRAVNLADQLEGKTSVVPVKTAERS